MGPEDGGYAITDEELDTDNEDLDVEEDLKLWLQQLESSLDNKQQQHSKRSVTTPKKTYSCNNVTTNVKDSSSVTSFNGQKKKKKTDDDFDSILGELDNLAFDLDVPSPAIVKNGVTKPSEKRLQIKKNQIGEDLDSQLESALSELCELGRMVANDGIADRPLGTARRHEGTSVKKKDLEITGNSETRQMQSGLEFIEKTVKLDTTAKNFCEKPLSLKAEKAEKSKDRETLRKSSISTNSHSSGCSTLSEKSVKSNNGRSTPMENRHQASLKVFSSDGSSKAVLVDDSTTVGHLCHILADKNFVNKSLLWGIIEQIPDLLMQRILEDHQFILDEIRGWSKDSSNRLVFFETPNKYDMFDDKIRTKPHLTGVDWERQVEEQEGWLHLKADGKKSWKKMNFILRSNGLYFSKGKGKQSDAICLQLLHETEVYSGVGWKKKYKAPTDFGFALKPSLLQKNNPEHIKYLCTDNQETMRKWISLLRLAKHNQHLYTSFCQSTDNLSCLASSDERTMPPPSHDQSGLNNRPRENETDVHDEKSESVDPQSIYRSSVTRRESAAAAADSASGSKMRAQIPITPQTARILLIQEPQLIQEPRSIKETKSIKESRSFKTLPRLGSKKPPEQSSLSVSDVTITRRPSFELNPKNISWQRSASPDLPPPPPPIQLLDVADEKSPTTPKVDSIVRKSGAPPPPPPPRDLSTKLSFRGKENVQTKNFILNLQRAIGQKKRHGAGGLEQLEMPLPPPPVYSDDPSYLDLGELPPPPAELLYELQNMKKQRPPTMAKKSSKLR